MNILLKIDSSIATIILNRPEIHNAFNDEFIKEFTTLLKKVEQDESIRLVILSADGKSFCAGADIKWMQKMASYSYEENLQDASALASLMQVLNNLSKPTIALVQGAAYGGGVGLVACCDIAIANTLASFCFSEVKIGLIPAVISPYVIRAIGERSARRYFLTAEKFDVREAYRLGLIHKIVEPEELLSVGNEIAKQFLANSPHAITTMKYLISEVSEKQIDQTLITMTSKAIADIRVSAEGQEGLKAFLEKRAPHWMNKD